MANQEQLEILKQGLEISTRGVYSILTEKVPILPGSYVDIFCIILQLQIARIPSIATNILD